MAGEVNPYLEALLELLESDRENSSDSDNLSLHSDVDQDMAGEDVILPEDNPEGQGIAQDNIGNQDVAPDYPPASNNLQSPHRPRSVLRYISSSSAKRRVQKPSHCHFCNVDAKKLELEQHLGQSESCKTLYFRKLHCKSIDAVLCVLYDCLYCDEQRVGRLWNHLEANEDCKQQYQERFSCNSSREVCDQIQALKRQTYKSKRSLARAFENKKAAEKKYLKLQTETEETTINRFNQSLLFSNYKTCSSCGHHLNTAQILTEESAIIKLGKFSLDGKEHLRRLDCYWICQSCQGLDGKQIPGPKQSTIQMFKLREGNEITFVPINESTAEIAANSEDFVIDDLSKVKIMMPASVGCLIGDNNKMPSATNFEIQTIVYGDSPNLDKNSAGLLYQTQRNKFWNVKNHSDRFSATISDLAGRKLSGVKSCSNDSGIVGSISHRNIEQEDIKWKLKLLGPWCLKLCVKFSPSDLMSKATTLVQQGLTVSSMFNSEGSQEMVKTYLVHNHDVAMECSQQCVKVPLDEYLQTNTVTPGISTYASSVEQTINSFITNILKSPSSSLECQKYHFQVHFSGDGHIELNGVCWPTFLDRINLACCDTSLSEDEKMEIRNEVLENVKQAILTTTDPLRLKAQINSNSEVELRKVQNIVADQVHICLTCDECKQVPLPSLDWMFTKCPRNSENVETSRLFLKFMRSQLLSLSIDDIKSSTTFQWLENVWAEIDDSELMEDDFWKLAFGEAEFLFKLTDDLSNLIQKFETCPLVGLYQYSMMTVNKREESQIILKRIDLIECFTSPFNLLFKRSLRCPIKIQIISKVSDLNDCCSPEPDFSSCQRIGLEHHISVSLAEAYCLTESRKLRLRSTNPLEYVYTGHKQEQFFKKVKEWNGNVFQVEGDSHNMYELIRTVITRFFNRLNGKKMILSEFVINYDYVGSEDSRLKFEVYRERLTKIKDSDTNYILDDQDFLPDLILCEGGDVMQKRKTFKIIKHPDFPSDSFDFKFSQVLLYHENEDFASLDEDSVSEKFEELVNGTNERIVMRNRRLLLKKVRSVFRPCKT